MARLKIGVMFGGWSEEHPVSVKSAQEVAKTLDLDEVRPRLRGDHDERSLEAVRRPRAGLGERARTAVLSPDPGVHGLLVLDRDDY